MVETATWLDNETVKLGRVKQRPLRVQRLRYPFPSRISPYAQDAQAHCAQWVVDHELVDDGELDRFNSFEIGICAARLFPETTAVGATWMADLFAWLTAFDDRFCDESATGLHPGRLTREVIVPLIRVFELPHVPVAPRAKFAVSLAELRDRLRGFGSAQQSARFASAARAYFLGIIWEAAHRESGEMPSIAEFVVMRGHAGAMWACLSVMDAVSGYDVPEPQFADPTVTRLRGLAINVIEYANDLYSYGRESEAQESAVLLNLVAVIAAERGCEVQAALDEARRMHDDELASYCGILPLAYRDAGPALRQHLDGFGLCVAGNDAWSMETTRYDCGDYFAITDARGNR